MRCLTCGKAVARWLIEHGQRWYCSSACRDEARARQQQAADAMPGRGGWRGDTSLPRQKDAAEPEAVRAEAERAKQLEREGVGRC